MLNPLEGEETRGQEREPDPRVTVQFAYFPVDIARRMRAIPQAEEEAAAFFMSGGSTTNIFAIEPPQLTGLNIPHFFEWQQKTGKFFEGYVQHTRTGFFRNRPFGAKQLAQVRGQAEQAVQQNPTNISEETLPQLYFYGSLLMLDRLAEKTPFTLVIEPRGGKDVLSLFKASGKLARALRRKEESESDEPFKDRKEVEALIEETRQEQTKEYQQIAAFLAPQVTSFHSFLSDTIEGAYKNPGQTRIFTPREALYYQIDNRLLKEKGHKGKEVLYAPPKLIGDQVEIYRDGHIVGRFLENPQAETSRAEAIRDLALSVIGISLDAIGLSYVLEQTHLHLLTTLLPRNWKKFYFRQCSLRG